MTDRHDGIGLVAYAGDRSSRQPEAAGRPVLERRVPRAPIEASTMSFETIVIVVIIVLIVLFVLGYFGRGRMRG